VTVPAGAPASTLAPGEDGPVWHTLRTDQVLQAEQVDGQHGLTSAEAAARVERFGLNTFDAGRVEPRWRAFVRQYADLMQLVLLGAGLVSLGLQEWETGIVLVLLTLFNAVLGLQQEGKAAAAVTALQTIEGKGYAADGPITRVAGEGEIPLDDFLLPMVLARAGTVFDADAGPVPVDGRARELYLAENQRLGEQGLRVLATARRDFDPATFDPGTDLLPLMPDLELLALVGIVDPPRPAAKASIATARKAGIKVRMITGDHGVTAAAIARQLGIDGTVITGAEVTKEAAVMILTDDNFSTIVKAVELGRGLYALFFTIATRDEHRTVFSLDTFADAKFVIATGVSILTLLLTTVFGPLQTFLKTTSLDVRQWLTCLAVALSIVVVSEVRKAVPRRRTVPSQPITR
jgi:magnesium-transporting ATPase (P-type)